MYGYPYYQNNFNQGFNQAQTSFNQAQTSFNQAPQDDRIWVSNQQAGEAYLISPNGFARLWDSSCNRFYERRADATGRPLPIEIYEYKRITPQNGFINDDTNKLSFDDINAQIEAINERIDKLEMKKGAVKNGKQSNADDTSI